MLLEKEIFKHIRKIILTKTC